LCSLGNFWIIQGCQLRFVSTGGDTGCAKFVYGLPLGAMGPGAVVGDGVVLVLCNNVVLLGSITSMLGVLGLVDVAS